jgi:quinoprotein glucose dehydrogenase
MKKIATALFGLSFLGIFHAILPAQSGASVWDGVYTEDQAKRGDAVYQKECASCHGNDLKGADQAPPLSGNEFKMDWNGLSVGDLFDRIRVSMPANQPGKLTPEEYADTLAFILKGNQFPAGKTELAGKSDSLKQIRFETAKPN